MYIRTSTNTHTSSTHHSLLATDFCKNKCMTIHPHALTYLPHYNYNLMQHISINKMIATILRCHLCVLCIYIVLYSIQTHKRLVHTYIFMGSVAEETNRVG